MKILAQATPNNTISGFQRAAEAVGHKWVWWEERHTPAFDVFDEVEPDIVFIMNVTRAMNKCVKELGIPHVQGNTVHPFSFRVNNTKMDFERLVDIHMFNPGPPSPAYECIAGVICSPHPTILNLCEGNNSINLCEGNNSIKIMSEEPWSVAQYLGIPSLVDKCNLYRSSQYVVISNMIEAMRVIACGSVPVSTQKIHEEISCIDEFDISLTRQDRIQRLKHLVVNHSYDDALKVILEEVK